MAIVATGASLLISSIFSTPTLPRTRLGALLGTRAGIRLGILVRLALRSPVGAIIPRTVSTAGSASA